MKKFEELKIEYNKNINFKKEVDCFLPVHLSNGLTETNLRKKNGTENEQYYIIMKILNMMLVIVI